MKKQQLSFITGVGAGLILAVIILTAWGIIWPGQRADQAGALPPPQISETQKGADKEPAEPAGAPDPGAAGETNRESQGMGPETSQPDVPPSAEIDRPSSVSDGNAPPLGEGPYETIEIPSGSTATQIATLLAEKGVISDVAAFRNLVNELQAARKFRTGKFEIREGASYEEIIQILTSPPNAQ